MADKYITLLSVLSVMLASGASFRIARFLFLRWQLESRDNFFFSVLCGGLAGLGMVYVSLAAIQSFGIAGALLSLMVAAPLAAFAWLYLIGTIKAFERILKGLLLSL